MNAKEISYKVLNLRKMIVQSFVMKKEKTTEDRVRVEREGIAPRAPIERPSRKLRETRAPRVSKRKYRLNRGDN